MPVLTIHKSYSKNYLIIEEICRERISSHCVYHNCAVCMYCLGVREFFQAASLFQNNYAVCFEIHMDIEIWNEIFTLNLLIKNLPR